MVGNSTVGNPEFEMWLNSLSVVQQAPPVAESRIAVTRSPWITGPAGV